MTYYEIILYKDGQLYDHFDRVESYTQGLEIAKKKSLEDWSEVALAKNVETDEDVIREWTKFYKNGKLLWTEKF